MCGIAGLYQWADDVDAVRTLVRREIVETLTRIGLEVEGVEDRGAALAAFLAGRHEIEIPIYRQLAGGVTSSNLLHGSANAIGGQNQVIKLRWGLLPEELKFAEAPWAPALMSLFGSPVVAAA